MERVIFLEQSHQMREILSFVNGKMVTYFQNFARYGVEVRTKQRPKNIKRLIRQAAKGVNVSRLTKAQEAIQLSYELRKKEKQVLAKEQREAEKRRKRLMKVQKGKAKAS